MRGVVGGVFASARVVSLGQPVDGVANIALTDQTQIVRANGEQAAITDIAPGTMIEATGRPSPPDTLVARRLVLP